MASMPGGLVEDKEADQSVQTLIEQVREALETKAGKTFSQYKAVTYRTQVVAGTNYFVKVQVDADEYVHLRVFKPLPNENRLPELSAYQLCKTKDDELQFFS
ncbi:cystatin-A1 isoform X1 [Aplysia californica]|uniref:Cystatin-A1 isoform X1 n=1 Tax=Aplysia californica TaxID=6500 RepID=A0ABM0JCN0_APLCA|nr:cystatin-A1 isoform X1 [Aplysia californica]